MPVPNVVIYYQQGENECSEKAIKYINSLIEKLEPLHKIKGVFIDRFGERSEFVELINSPLSQFDYIFINNPIEDEFDNRLLNELARTENFKLFYFSEIQD
jgi:hypothetical protein